MRERIMNRQDEFDVKNLSSRKLWELLSKDRFEMSYDQQQQAENELLLRGHYRQELQQLTQESDLNQQQFHHNDQWQTGVQQLG